MPPLQGFNNKAVTPTMPEKKDEHYISVMFHDLKESVDALDKEIELMGDAIMPIMSQVGIDSKFNSANLALAASSNSPLSQVVKELTAKVDGLRFNLESYRRRVEL